MTNFIDSNIFVKAVTKHPQSKQCLEIVNQGGIIDSLILLEIHAKIATITKDEGFAEKALKKILGDENISIFPLDANLFFEAMKRKKKYLLTMSDLIHYTTAILYECQSMISYDKDFDKLEIPRIEP
tara:strand:- start:10 stop:390 length:381 start_codon:yes stop_codon:yes gene_type:complete